MKLSKRLTEIVNLIECDMKVADIGTDHGYIPIYLIQNNISDFVIASDINKGPIEILLKNLKENNIENGVYERIGEGLKVLKVGEVDIAVIAGMGGNLISNIIDESLEISKNLKYMILQPAQYPEVLRKYLYENGFEILKETLTLDANKYYYTMKVVFGGSNNYDKEVSYYIGTGSEGSEYFKGYILNKIASIEKIIGSTEKGVDKTRFYYLKNLLEEFKEVKKKYGL